MAKRKTFVIDETILEIKSDHNEIRIPKPTSTLVKLYLDKWNSSEVFIVQEQAIKKIFSSYSKNTDLSDIYIKSSVLNIFYNTNIFSILPVAQHILNIQDMDSSLKQGDETLIEEFKKVDLGGKKPLNLYSFATKYCHFHNVDAFPLYDRYIDELLRIFRNIGGIEKFKNDDLKKYSEYKKILQNFKTLYKLDQYSTKDFDIFLWQFGKDIVKKKQALA